MAFLVEDGTGLASANSYLSVADANSYHTDRNNTAWTGTDAVKEYALIQATSFLDALFALRWPGYRYQKAQRLAWPRWDVIDYDGYERDANVVPVEVKDATAELALRALTETLNPDVAAADRNVTRERVKAAVVEEEKEYAGGKLSAKSYPVILGILKPLLHTTGTVERS